MQTDFQTIATQAIQFIMPEGILTLFACAALVLDVMLPRDRKRFVAVDRTMRFMTTLAAPVRF